ncbi:hypothetical protein [Kitasatospora viridis]|uniref:Uncharacterized protein n=1 Tax=Kitasatospora viridis TaxID=281105 RepID=A0A561UCZ6_9ACTN|nr:hypothetical protein [Kitasatospora viridis]TWF97229.1 hypothetical protein FHX73_111009 [Kitasatospora viridis]
MAERFTALADLKTAFAKFGDMSHLIDEMRGKVDEVNAFNKDAAGSDDIGKQYHQTVDQPTSDLTDLLTQVRKAVDKVGQNGQDAKDLFDKNDSDLKDSTNGF